MSKSKSVVSVHIDIAALTWATRGIDSQDDWATWGRTFVEALATQKPELNEFAASLIQNVVDFRAEEAERIRILREQKDVQVHSVHSVQASVQTDRIDSQNRQLVKKEKKQHPWFLDAGFQEAWKDWEKSRKEKAGEFQLRKLLKLSGENMETALLILEESTGAGWKGLFALKGNHGTNNRPTRHERLEAGASDLLKRLKGKAGDNRGPIFEDGLVSEKPHARIGQAGTFG